MMPPMAPPAMAPLLVVVGGFDGVWEVSSVELWMVLLLRTMFKSSAREYIASMI